MITYFPRNFKVQDYVDITLKGTRYFNQTASVTLTLIKRLHVIWVRLSLPSIDSHTLQ